jgi:hypothetical protein
MGDEKRRRSRVCAQFEAYVYSDGEKIPVTTLNISMKGALLGPEPRLAAGQDCTLVFTLSKDINVRLRARIVRVSDEGLAVDFESMDESAFFHLRNMVRYSSQDADKIDQELQVPAFDASDGEKD